MLELSVDQQALAALGRALAAEADGKALRRELAANLRKAVEPAKQAAVGELMSMATGGMAHGEEPLRVAVARQVKAEARLSGRSTGVRLKAMKKRMPREFHNAPKRLNSVKGWRHQVFGRDVYVEQTGKPGWFDDPIAQDKDEYRQAVLDAMESMAQRISERAR